MVASPDTFGGSSLQTPRRGPARLIASLSVVSSLLGLSSTPAARAATPTTCVFDNEVATVTVGEGAGATIGRSGDAVTVDGVPCGAATVANTELIDVAVADVPEPELVVVDLSDGPLAPGATDEGDGSSEIEIEITGTQGSFDTLRVVGSTGPEALAAKFFSVNLNADEVVYDDDVTTDGPNSLELRGGEGADFLALQGFGLNVFTATVLGGPGDDRLTGDLMDDDEIDGGPGHDVADYSWVGDELGLVWEDGTGTVSADSSSDELAGVEEVILTDGIDTVAYLGDSTGETWTGADADSVTVVDPTPGGDATERVIHGGSGAFDSIRFDSSPGQARLVELTQHTIGGSWSAKYFGIEYVFGEYGDDRFRITERGAYPTIFGGDGRDVIDLRAARQGISVTLGRPTFGPRKWVEAFEIERVLGSDFDDVFIGPSASSTTDPVELIGFLGRDDLRGGEGPDLLVGGEGPDTLRGFGGADTLKGWLGADSLFGGSGPDVLRGGPGIDICDGGPGNDSFTSC